MGHFNRLCLINVSFVSNLKQTNKQGTSVFTVFDSVLVTFIDMWCSELRALLLLFFCLLVCLFFPHPPPFPCVDVDSGVVCEPCESFFLSGSIFLLPSLTTVKVSRMKRVAWVLLTNKQFACFTITFPCTFFLQITHVAPLLLLFWFFFYVKRNVDISPVSSCAFLTSRHI